MPCSRGSRLKKPRVRSKSLTWSSLSLSCGASASLLTVKPFLILSWAINQLLSGEGSQPGDREGTSITGHRDGDHSQIVPADEYFCPISQVAVGTEAHYLFLLRPRKEVVYGSAVIPR